MKGRTVEEIQEREYIEDLVRDAISMFITNRLIMFLCGKKWNETV